MIEWVYDVQRGLIHTSERDPQSGMYISHIIDRTAYNKYQYKTERRG